MSLCLPDFEYNNSTGLCDKFEIIPPTDCTAINKFYNKNFINFYNPVSKKCEYNDKTIDNTTGTTTEISTTIDPNCAPNTIKLSNKQCKRLVSIEPNKTTNYILYIFIFIVVLITLGIGYKYTRKKNSNSFNR
jgi:hypothetical protein